MKALYRWIKGIAKKPYIEAVDTFQRYELLEAIPRNSSLFFPVFRHAAPTSWFLRWSSFLGWKLGG